MCCSGPCFCCCFWPISCSSSRATGGRPGWVTRDDSVACLMSASLRDPRRESSSGGHVMDRHRVRRRSLTVLAVVWLALSPESQAVVQILPEGALTVDGRAGHDHASVVSDH